MMMPITSIVHALNDDCRNSWAGNARLMSRLPQPKGLIFDLEVVPPKNNEPARIMIVGALQPDSGAELELRVSGNPSIALQRDHDLPILRAHLPGMVLPLTEK